MGTLLINVSDQLKEKYKDYCEAENLTMTKLIVDFITATVNKDKFVDSDTPTIQKCTCLLCNFEWVPRAKRPVVCPSCKSYTWDNAEASDKRRIAQGKREQAAMYAEFQTQYNRIIKQTEFQMISEVADLLGTTADKLKPYIKQEKPVTREQIERMKQIKP